MQGLAVDVKLGLDTGLGAQHPFIDNKRIVTLEICPTSLGIAPR